MSNVTIPIKPKETRATDKQWQAMMARNHNLLVSASAGSGKTFVLVQRILSLIREQHPLTHLLVVTYTEVAAKEMKERLERELKKAFEQSKNDQEKQLLQESIYLMGKANISTIHAFCLQVIRRFFYLKDIDPVFTLMTNDAEKYLLLERVWNQMEEEWLLQKEYRQLFRYFSNDRSDQGISELMFQLYEYSRTNPNPKEWLKKLPDLYHEATEWHLHPLVQSSVLPDIRERLTTALALSDELTKLAETSGMSEKRYQLIYEENKLIAQLERLLKEDNFEAIFQLIQRPKFFGTWTQVIKMEKEAGIEGVLQELKNKRERIIELIRGIKSDYFYLSPSQQLEQIHVLYEDVMKLSQAALEYYDAVQKEKARLNQLDFSDLEHITLEILSYQSQAGDYPAARYYQDLFDEILVDEYQDVNQVQEAILQRIARKGAHQDNLFMVGDVKQSIYSFRQADPSLFIHKYEAFTHIDHNQPSPYREDGGVLIPLLENFRSRSDVLDFTNLIFKQLMNKELGQIDYDDTAELVTGNHQYPEDTLYHTEILAIESESTQEENDELEEDFSSIELEISAAAIRIKEWIEAKYSIMDADNGHMRPISYRDIAILTPTKKHNSLIEDCFKRFSIPVLLQKTEEYFKRSEISTMLALLKIIDNPYQDIPLVAVLRSGIVGLDEQDLAMIRLQKKQGAYYEACKKLIQKSNLMAIGNYSLSRLKDLQEKIRKFFLLFNQWRSIAAQASLSQLIDRIYDDTQFLAYVEGQLSGAQRRLNLEALLDRARMYEASSLRGLHSFIRFIEQMQKQEKDLMEPVQLSEDEDAVRVMTIHASKGLEYPLVFLLNTSKSFNTQEMRKDYILSDQFGIGIKYLDQERRVQYPTFGYNVIKNELLKKAYAEEMRKLYVAMTRARDKLIIIGTVKSKKDYEAKWAEIQEQVEEWVLPVHYRFQSPTYFDWIGLCLARLSWKNQQVTFMDRTIGLSLNYLTSADIKSESTRYVATLDREVRTNETILLGSKEENHSIHLKKPTAYAYQTQTVTTSYQSVSELKRLLEDPDITESQPYSNVYEGNLYLKPTLTQPQLFVEGSKKVSGAEIGTAVHLLMQKVDLRKGIKLEDIKDTLTRLVSQKLIRPEVAAKIDCDQCLDFYQTDFGQFILEHAPLVKKEQPFSFLLSAEELFDLSGQDDAILIHGIMDGFIELDSELILYDYKTDFVLATERGIAEICEKYQSQLDIYARALESCFHKPVTKKMLCLLSIGKNIDLGTETARK